MALLERVDQLNNKQRLIILVVIIALLAGGFYYFVYRKNQTTITGLESTLSSLQTDIQGLRAIQAKLREFEAERDSLQKQLMIIRRKLPQQKEIPGLLESISNAGKESGLEFDLFRPRSEGKKEFYAEVPVDITVKGPFHNIVMFLDKIAHFPRIVNISNFSFKNPQEENGYIFITGSGLATTYRYLEQN